MTTVTPRIETVTPEIAAAWLLANKNNRRMRHGIVESYASDMASGNWTQCIEPISFYADGDLADGQHRLKAIVDTGTTQVFIVVRGLSREDGLNINAGFGRTIVDNARISGAHSHLTTVLQSAARAIELGSPGVNRRLSHAEVLAMVHKHQPAAEFASANVRRVRYLCTSPILGAVGRAHLHEEDKDRLKRFCDVFGTGLYDGPSEVSGAAFRSYVQNKGPAASTTALWRDTFFKAQNAIHYFMRGKKLTHIKAVAEEVYPLQNALQKNLTQLMKQQAARRAKAPGEQFQMRIIP